VVEALATDRLDLAWLGGFTFVQARLKTGNAIPLVQREQDASSPANSSPPTRT
jgi:phosphonate transport system substrate-binding protein